MKLMEYQIEMPYTVAYDPRTGSRFYYSAQPKVVGPRLACRTKPLSIRECTILCFFLVKYLAKHT